MQKRVLYIGLDVDDNKFHGYCICEKTGEAFPFTSRPNASKLISTLNRSSSYLRKNGMFWHGCCEWGSS